MVGFGQTVAVVKHDRSEENSIKNDTKIKGITFHKWKYLF